MQKRSSSQSKVRGAVSADNLTRSRRQVGVGKQSSILKPKASSARESQRRRDEGNVSEEEVAFFDDKPSTSYSVDLHGKYLTQIAGTEKYTRCKSLDLSCNQIKKIENLHQNPEICELKLYSNEISSVKGLEKLKRLQNLQLQHNQITEIGDGLKELKSLKILHLGSNKLTSLEAHELKTCSNITFLDLSNNNLSTLQCLMAVPYLEELYVGGNQLTKCPDASCCKKLQEIDLSRNHLADVRGIKNLPNLTIINISNNPMLDLKSLGASRTLQQLDVSGNEIKALLHIAQQFPNLETLIAADNNITEWKEVLQLKTLKELKELYLDGNPMKKDIESTYNVNWSRRVSDVLPQIEILDGHQVARPQSKSGERLPMRPMTASQGLSTKMVYDQINVMNHEISFYENMIKSRFAVVHNMLESLPKKSTPTQTEGGSNPDNGPLRARTDDSQRPSTSNSDTRPTSRCGSRTRIREALEFASRNFSQSEETKDKATNDNSSKKGEG